MQRLKLQGNFSGLKVAVGIVLMLSASFASAHNRSGVNWSVTVGTPYPAQVYSPPPVNYTEPRVVYVPREPVYFEPAPVVQYRPYRPGNYYVEEQYFSNPRYYKRHRHHHHRDRWGD